MRCSSPCPGRPAPPPSRKPFRRRVAAPLDSPHEASGEYTVIDLKAARQEPDRYRAALARRGAAQDFDALLAADARWRELTERAESLRAAQKRSSKGGPPAPEELAELRRLAADLAVANEERSHAQRERDELLARIP